MQAGRELDALVAEKVMGFEVVEVERKTSAGVKWTEPMIGDAWDTRSIPDYSTDIAAAWSVVEKLHAEGRTVRVTAYHRTDLYVGPAFSVEITTARGLVPQEGWSIIEEQARSPAHAICLAALKAVGAGMT